jgi:sugar phosphate isomerase/epimerase
MDIGILLSVTGYVAKSFFDAAKAVSSIGYDHVELGANRIIRDPNLADLGPFSDFEAEEVVLWMRELGLQVSAIECHVEYVARRTADIANAARHTIRVLDIAKHVGVRFVHTVSGRLHPGMTEEDGYRALVAAYRDLLRYAEEAGVKLGIQPVFIYLVANLASTQRLLEQVAREDLFINFDPSAFVFHRESAVDFIKAFGKKILHVLARDAVVEPLNAEEVSRYQAFDMGGGEQFKLALPGEGVVNWPEIIGALRGVGFDGVVSVGLPRGTEEPEEAAAKVLKFLKQCVPAAEEARPLEEAEELPDLGPF